MKKNDLIRIDDTIYRVLDISEDKALLIDCFKKTMPSWTQLGSHSESSEEELIAETNTVLTDLDTASLDIQKKVRERYNLQ
mgnify:CR=1 FL=1